MSVWTKTDATGTCNSMEEISIHVQLHFEQDKPKKGGSGLVFSSTYTKILMPISVYLYRYDISVGLPNMLFVRAAPGENLPIALSP